MKFYKIFLAMFLQSIKLKDTTIWCGLKKAHSINFGKFKFCVIRFSLLGMIISEHSFSVLEEYDLSFFSKYIKE